VKGNVLFVQIFHYTSIIFKICVQVIEILKKILYFIKPKSRYCDCCLWMSCL